MAFHLLPFFIFLVTLWAFVFHLSPNPICVHFFYDRFWAQIWVLQVLLMNSTNFSLIKKMILIFARCDNNINVDNTLQKVVSCKGYSYFCWEFMSWIIYTWQICKSKQLFGSFTKEIHQHEQQPSNKPFLKPNNAMHSLP